MLDINGVSLSVGETIAQTGGWSLVRISGSSGSAIIRGKDGKVLEMKDITLTGDERKAFLVAYHHGLLDPMIY